MKNITFYPSEKSSLGKKQVEVLSFAAQGLTKSQIANLICRSIPTVATHQVEARNHYGARSLTQAVAYAIAAGDIQFRVGPVNPSPLRSRATAIAMIMAALVTTAVDTPFFSDVDQTLVRHHTTRTTRSAKSMRGRSRRDQLDLAII